MIRQLLIDIRWTLANGWCQNAHAIDNDSKEVHIDSPDAIGYDLITAIYKSVAEENLDEVYATIGMTPIEAFEWNNDPNRTQKEVLQLLDKAIQRFDNDEV